ncbi:MAG: ABC transporter ATP-binding protein [bacterium]
MNDAVITVQGVGKRFRLKHHASRTLKATALDFVRGRRRPASEFWALKDVCFTVKRGETLGIIGANGAGKSTLMALISGTMPPTTGTISATGTISSLLELGAGFHPELTGRENVFLYGAIMGLTRKQMTRRFDTIVEFSELGKWIDEPVKHYSSGMYVRLGFAVAVEVDPDILLIDEVLAVGDATFQRKCLDRMKEYRTAGKTMIIISHDLPTITSVSDRLLFLENGTVHGIGTPSGMVEEYQEFIRRKQAASAKRVWGTQEVIIDEVVLDAGDGVGTDQFRCGGPLVARIRYTAKHPVPEPVFGFAVADINGHVVYGNNTQIEKCDLPRIDGKGEIAFRIEPLGMSRGTYLLSFSVHSADHKTNYFRLENTHQIHVTADKSFEGCFMPCRWSTK